MTIAPTALAEPVVGIAREAGARILEIYHSADFEVQAKSDQSPLTAADLASHRHIVAALSDLTPAIPVMSEESTAVPFAERSKWQQYWLVDPLDGTKEFIKRNGEFTVNIALIDNHEVALGVVYVPVQGVSYFGVRGGGAFAESDGDSAGPTPIAVTQPCAQPVRIVGSRSHAGPSLQAFAAAVGEHELVSIGSSLKLCLVATGSADVYPRLGPTSEWDTAAAQGVVEHAGGQVVTLDGKRLAYNTKESVLNPYFLVYADAGRDWLGMVPADA